MHEAVKQNQIDKRSPTGTQQRADDPTMLEAATKDRTSDERPVYATEEGRVHGAVKQNGNASNFDEVCKTPFVSKGQKVQRRRSSGKLKKTERG